MIVTYKDKNAQGQTFTKEETLFAPQVIIQQQDIHRLYSLVMIDPDTSAPYFLHWMLINIDLGESTFQEIVSYYPPTPPKGTHRYIFYVLQQSGYIKMTAPKNRTRFSLQVWIHAHGLRIVDETRMRVLA